MQEKRLKNIISKTALKTLLIVLIAVVLAFGVASLGFPQHMATFFENTGSYKIATGYASLAYTYSDTFENLVRCVDDSILSGDDSNIVSFASRLIAAEEFGEYCSLRDEEFKKNLNGSGFDASTEFSYKQYVAGHLSCSQYALGNTDGALETAKNAMSGEYFPANNAYAMLATRAASRNDAEMKEKLLSEIESVIQSGSFKPEQYEYLQTVKNLLEK